MAKLANVAVSEAVGVTSLGVRVSPWALQWKAYQKWYAFLFCSHQNPIICTFCWNRLGYSDKITEKKKELEKNFDETHK